MSSTPSVAPENLERRASTFLSLAPATSASYPQQKTQKSAPKADGAEEKRRSSSSSSGPRILKLGPVHGGQHLGEHDEDWHEVAVV